MKLKCISTSTNIDNMEASHFRWLTIDKIYEVHHLAVSNNKYYIVDDIGETNTYPKHCFIGLQELRDNKLNELGI